MNSRERVIRTFQFRETDRPACDLMEGIVWDELQQYFLQAHGCPEKEDSLAFLDPDFRWTVMNRGWRWNLSESMRIRGRTVGSTHMGASLGPLADATLDDIMTLAFANTDLFQPDDYRAVRARYPQKALVFWPGWIPLFWSACEAFGSEEALVKMLCEPDSFDGFIRAFHEMTMDVLRRGLQEAKGVCDVCLLGDDVATQRSMLISPESWRKHIKPYLAEQVRAVRDSGIYVMFHSCGSVRPILPDLIDIGVNALLVFQTNAAGMDAESISRDFGGRLAFYGGIDVQKLLCDGTPEDVTAAVEGNLRAFERCGGYVVANSHHGTPDIRGENLEAMFRAAKGFHRH